MTARTSLALVGAVKSALEQKSTVDQPLTTAPPAPIPADMLRLKQILEYRRAHMSEGEAAFVADMLMPYKPTAFVDDKDFTLAYVLDVGHMIDGTLVVPPVLWSCHIDTVHYENTGMGGSWDWDAENYMSVYSPPSDDKTPKIKQEVIYDETLDMMLLPKTASQCLGADDGAGVWLLMEMIDAGVPGTYVFHRGEERGGVGSRAMAVHHADWLKRFKWAIAFDRANTDNVITQQAGGVCCSKKFAKKLAAAINAHSTFLAFKPDPTGIFTDTASYIHLIPECTNLSVGYDSNHTSNEDLDCYHLKELRRCVIEAFKDGIDLPVVREAKPKETHVYSGRYANMYNTRKRDPLPEDAEDIATTPWSALVSAAFDAKASDIADLLLKLAEQIELQRETIEMYEKLCVKHGIDPKTMDLDFKAIKPLTADEAAAKIAAAELNKTVLTAEEAAKAVDELDAATLALQNGYVPGDTMEGT